MTRVQHGQLATSDSRRGDTRKREKSKEEGKQVKKFSEAVRRLRHQANANEVGAGSIDMTSREQGRGVIWDRRRTKKKGHGKKSKVRRERLLHPPGGGGSSHQGKRDAKACSRKSNPMGKKEKIKISRTEEGGGGGCGCGKKSGNAKQGAMLTKQEARASILMKEAAQIKRRVRSEGPAINPSTIFSP